MGLISAKVLVREIIELVVEDDKHRLYGKLALHVSVVGHDVRVDQLVRQIGSILHVSYIVRELHDKVLKENLNVARRRDTAVRLFDLKEHLLEVSKKGRLVRLHEHLLDCNERALH